MPETQVIMLVHLAGAMAHRGAEIINNDMDEDRWQEPPKVFHEYLGRNHKTNS